MSTLPSEVREAMKAAISDKRTPYGSRRNKSYDDGRIYEVIRLDNPDWRDVITDDQTVMGRFPNDKEADALCADLEAEFRLDAALSALEAAGWEVNRKGTADNVRAELTARAKEMQSARDALIWIRDELEDEGDRVYFGSTNHAEQFREAVESMDEWSWHDIMRASRDTDYIGQGRIAAQKRDDLAMLVRRIIYRHSKELPLDEVLAAADDYLARNRLNGSPLRDEPALTASNPKEKPDV